MTRFRGSIQPKLKGAPIGKILRTVELSKRDGRDMAKPLFQGASSISRDIGVSHKLSIRKVKQASVDASDLLPGTDVHLPRRGGCPIAPHSLDSKIFGRQRPTIQSKNRPRFGLTLGGGNSGADVRQLNADLFFFFSTRFTASNPTAFVEEQPAISVANQHRQLT